MELPTRQWANFRCVLFGAAICGHGRVSDHAHVERLLSHAVRRAHNHNNCAAVATV